MSFRTHFARTLPRNRAKQMVEAVCGDQVKWPNRRGTRPYITSDTDEWQELMWDLKVCPRCRKVVRQYNKGKGGPPVY